jgi:Ca2+-binding EF-hand superfamily protein
MDYLNVKEVIKIEKLESTFRYFDINNDEFIDSSDVKKVTLRFGKKIFK